MLTKIDFKTWNDKYILSEIEKINYLYNLSGVIRYGLKRAEKIRTQSVSEHVLNMLYLANYFKEFEDPNRNLRWYKVIDMIMMHDLGEIETGDIPMTTKTKNDEKVESEMQKKVAEKSPKFIAKYVEEIHNEFEERASLEAKFVKAIDAFEAMIWYGKYNDLKDIKTITKKVDIIKNEKKRFKVFKDCGFKLIERFGKVLYKDAVTRGLLN